MVGGAVVLRAVLAERLWAPAVFGVVDLAASKTASE
jgi:hypothetical protein